MRQSEGNSTQNRLSAARHAQGSPAQEGVFPKTIGRRATSKLARIRSSVLLKTASFALAAGRIPPRRDYLKV
jgi:hypothetical protein